MANLTLEQASAQIAALQAQLTEAKAAATRRVSLKVGEKGTVCLYHGGRYPVALYASQWEAILPYLKSGHVEAFIAANRHLLATAKA